MFLFINLPSEGWGQPILSPCQPILANSLYDSVCCLATVTQNYKINCLQIEIITKQKEKTSFNIPEMVYKKKVRRDEGAIKDNFLNPFVWTMSSFNYITEYDIIYMN